MAIHETRCASGALFFFLVAAFLAKAVHFYLVSGDLEALALQFRHKSLHGTIFYGHHLAALHANRIVGMLMAVDGVDRHPVVQHRCF